MVDQGGEGGREESQIVVTNGKEGEETRHNSGSNLRPSHLIMAGEVWLEVAV